MAARLCIELLGVIAREVAGNVGEAFELARDGGPVVGAGVKLQEWRCPIGVVGWEKERGRLWLAFVGDIGGESSGEVIESVDEDEAVELGRFDVSSASEDVILSKSVGG